MNIFNTLNFSFIFNLTISITISLFVFFIFGKAISDLVSDLIKENLKRLFKWCYLKIMNYFCPLSLSLNYLSPSTQVYSGVTTNRINARLTKNVGFGIDLQIIINSKSKHWNSLFHEIQILLFDPEDILGIYSTNRQAGLPVRHIIGSFKFKVNERKNIHIDFRPSRTIKEYEVPIYVILIGNNDYRLNQTLIFGSNSD
jgi:hypothetical protein